MGFSICGMQRGDKKIGCRNNGNLFQDEIQLILRNLYFRHWLVSIHRFRL